MTSPTTTHEIEQTTLAGGETLRRPTCRPPWYPARTCDGTVDRVLTVAGGKAGTEVWRVCDEHAGQIREESDVREDRPYNESRDGYEVAE